MFLSLIEKSFEGWPFLGSICFVSCNLHFLTVASTGLSGVSKHLVIVWYLFPVSAMALLISHAFVIHFMHFLFMTIVHCCPAESQIESLNWVLWFTANCNAIASSLSLNLWNHVTLELRELKSVYYCLLMHISCLEYFLFFSTIFYIFYFLFCNSNY